MTVDSQAFDYVHDTQAVFRELLTAFSFPGRIVDIGEQSKKAAQPALMHALPGTPAVILALLLTLIDQESPYSLVPEIKLSGAKAAFATVLGAAPVSLDKASFVFCLDDLPQQESVPEALSRGDLTDPHSGATLIQYVPSVETGMVFSIEGPGLEQARQQKFPLSPAWLASRNRAVEEFPMGIDVILADAEGKLLVLPRTTKMTQAVV